jgi:hypothetical protein
MRTGDYFNRGDKKVAASFISRATRLSLDGCLYKRNTKKYMGGLARSTTFPFLPYVCSSDKRGKATVILQTGEFTKTIDLVKALTVCHVFSAADRPVAGDYDAHVKGA